MQLFNHLSLRKKITIIIVSTVLVTLSIGFGIETYTQLSSIKERILAEKILTAKIVLSNCFVKLT